MGELFAGYGGLGLGVAQVLDVKLAWYADACKFDKDGHASHHDPCRAPCSIMGHRFPGVPNLGDVTAVDWSQVEPVDVLTGGSPCQDLSHAGKRAGMTEGTRSNLWVAMREAIAQLRPSLVVWENVEGAASAEADSEVEPCPGCVGDGTGVHLRALGRVVGDLASLGYVGRVGSLRAADVGAPHGRRRRFLVAYPADLGHERGGYARGGWIGPADSDRAPVGVDDSCLAGALLPTPRATDGTKGGPNQRGSSGDLMLPSAVTLLPTPAVNDMGAAYTPDEWDAWTERMKAGHNNGNGHGKSLNIEAQRLSLDVQRWGPYAEAIQRWVALTRPAPDPTRPDGKNGRARLNPEFSEWMMGLPAGWVTDVPGITRNEALKAIGNGVVPQQAAAALRYLLSLDVAGVAA